MSKTNVSAIRYWNVTHVKFIRALQHEKLLANKIK